MRIRARGGITTGFRDYPRMPRRFPANRAEYRNWGLAARRIIGLVREMGGEAMSKARTWSVRLSVDDLNASFCLLETDQEVASWVRGLMRGLNAGECKDAASKEYAEGWEIGRPAREKADEIRAERAETGSKGGSKRVANAQAIASPTASPIGKPTAQPERRTKNEEQQERKTKARQAAFSPSMFNAMIPVDLAKSGAFVSKWNLWVESRHGRRKPISELAAKEQLDKLAGFGLLGAIESLRQSIEGDWQGIFPPKDPGFAPAPAQPQRQAVARELSYAEQQQLLPMSQRWKS